MYRTPYLNGKILINYSQVAQLLKLYCGFETDFDPNRQVKVLYRNAENPDGVPLHEAFALFTHQMIEKANAGKEAKV